MARQPMQGVPNLSSTWDRLQSQYAQKPTLMDGNCTGAGLEFYRTSRSNFRTVKGEDPDVQRESVMGLSSTDPPLE